MGHQLMQIKVCVGATLNNLRAQVKQICDLAIVPSIEPHGILALNRDLNQGPAGLQ